LWLPGYVYGNYNKEDPVTDIVHKLNQPQESDMTSRRNFLKSAGIGGAATLAAPAIVKAQAPDQVALSDLCRCGAG
jgi:hypothetical protein